MGFRLERGHTGSKSDRKPYAVLDIETDGLRGPLLYWTATCECPGDHFRDGHDARGLWDWILKHESRDHANRDHVWWAHNGGEYDYIYLFGSAKADAEAREAVVHPVMQGDRMIGFRVTHSKHRTDLRDSYALLPAGLAALADQLAPELPKLDIGLSKGVTFDPDSPVHRAYARRDVEALLAVMVRYRSIMAERFDGTLPSWSAAGTAMRAWQQTLAEGVSYSPGHHRTDVLARAGYYGGLVHPGSVALHRDVATIDENSMYPTVMRANGVPTGWSTPVNRYRPGRPGFYIVEATVPLDQPFTFIPYRDPKGILSWPTGRFETVISSLELDAARARGIKIRVISGSIWERIDHPFDEFVNRIEAMRAEGGPLALTGKLNGNGLYGKFGTRPDKEEWAISDLPPGPDWMPGSDDPNDLTLYGLWKHHATIHAPYLLPHWAAWITAGARLELLRLVEAIGPELVIYTDTDSVTAPREAIEAAIGRGTISVGPAFGQVKIESRWHSYRVVASKVYRGVTMDGKRIRKAKGIRRADRAAAFGGKVVTWDSPNAAIQVLRGAPMITTRERRISNIEHSPAWRVIDAAGHVRPVHLGY